jgi:hypothetical protein
MVSIYSKRDKVNPYTLFWSCMTKNGSYSAISTRDALRSRCRYGSLMSQKNLTDGSILQ